MKAAVFREAGKPLQIEQVEDPTPGPRQVVIEVRRCGICGTDLHGTEDHDATFAAGTIAGHEYVGEVVAAGTEVAPEWRTGARVTGLPFYSCGDCTPCRLGQPWQCPERSIIGMQHPGAFATYLSVAVHTSLLLPPSLDWVEGALIEPMAVGLHAVKMASRLDGRRVLVLGAGPVGLSVAYWARFLGARNIVVSEPEPLRNEAALRYGATETIDPRAAEDPGREFERLTGGAPDVIFECVGVPGMISQAIDLAPYGSEVLVVGFCMRQDYFVPAIAMAKELVVRFVLSYHREDFDFIAGMMAHDRVDVASMCTGTVGFGELPDAFERLRKPNEHCKLMLAPD